MRNKSGVLLIFLILSLTLLWMDCPSDSPEKPEDGLLPSLGTISPTPEITPDESTSEPPKAEPPYDYQKMSLTTSGGPLVLHFLTIDLKNPGIIVKPVTSHRTLFGYKYLSEMASEHNALAAINGGFSFSNGLPGGMIYANRELKTPATGKYPVLFLAEDRALLSDASHEIWLESEGKILAPVTYNSYSEWGGLFAFTPVYGSTDRIDKKHLTATVSNGVVKEMTLSQSMTDIPADGFLVSAVGNDVQQRLKAFIKPGMNLELKTKLSIEAEPELDYLSAYECGSWIIKNGVNVSPIEDGWAGNLTGRAPRTAVGIKEDGSLVFVVADGRQDESVGVGAPELASILLEMNIKNAALLDGGASSEMILDGKIVNSPSAGRERMLFSCFLLLEK